MRVFEVLKLMRIHQYVKNLFIFLPLFFSLKITDMTLLGITFLGFIAFSLTASAIYILNDYQDIDEDRLHPIKKNRPLASGTISKNEAILLMSIFFLFGFSLMISLSWQAGLILLGYVVLNVSYTFSLKHVAIIDIIIIAVGFVLRVFVGTAISHMNTSMWIIVMTFLLALFLALAKRRDDVILFNKTGKKMRKVVDGYNLQFVDMAMTLMAGVVIVAYLMYCVSPEVIVRTGSDKLYLTLIYVIVGIMRYMQIAFVEETSGSPTRVLLKDKMMQLVIVMWIVTFSIILY